MKRKYIIDLCDSPKNTKRTRQLQATQLEKYFLDNKVGPFLFDRKDIDISKYYDCSYRPDFKFSLYGTENGIKKLLRIIIVEVDEDWHRSNMDGDAMREHRIQLYYSKDNIECAIIRIGIKRSDYFSEREMREVLSLILHYHQIAKCGYVVEYVNYPDKLIKLKIILHDLFKKDITKQYELYDKDIYYEDNRSINFDNLLLIFYNACTIDHKGNEYDINSVSYAFVKWLMSDIVNIKTEELSLYDNNYFNELIKNSFIFRRYHCDNINFIKNIKIRNDLLQNNTEDIDYNSFVELTGCDSKTLINSFTSQIEYVK